MMTTDNARGWALRMPGSVWSVVVLATLATLVATVGRPAVAADQEFVENQVEAALAAGEFGPALRAARAIGDTGQRDMVLAQVARAQARVGLGDGSLSTIADVSDDRLRTDLLRDNGSAGRETSGAQGGGSQADFDALIELIQTTISPDSWEANGGAGSLQEFVSGVLVDANGVLQLSERGAASGRLDSLRRQVRPSADTARHSSDAARHMGPSPMRSISLNRLERQIQLREAAGLPPTEAMRLLAGLERVRYVFVYPESGDLVLAGPADSWIVDPSGRARATRSGRPLVRLDDLVVTLRRDSSGPNGRFGCAITPTSDSLAKTHAFLRKSARQPLRPGGGTAWLERLRTSLGRQEISIFGVDPATHLAQVLVAADYRMKRVGMGLDAGVAGVPSYLDLIDVPPGQSPPPLTMLRWWFVLDDDAVVTTTDDRRAFQLVGQGVKVLSENELLTAQGQRVHTGRAEALNRQFASSFTANFAALAVKYPIYAELQNVFDLALVAALISAEDLPSQVGWHMTWFGDQEGYQVATAPPPAVVETVINHRVIRRRIILAGASGGVSVETSPFVTHSSIRIADEAQLAGQRARAARDLPRANWWWD
jgi:hypothetical protein